MSSTKVICFMYQHAKHCTLSKETAKTVSSEIFTLFPQLPAELRLKIWEEYAAQPRTVELTCTPTSSNLPEGRWFSHTKPPRIFLVCSESRQVGIAKYSKLDFSSDQVGLPIKGGLYFNFSVDTLWLCADLSAPWARNLLAENEQLKKNLRFLAVTEETWKQVNEVEYTPSWTGYTGSRGSLPLPVRCGLSALEDIKFHS